MVATLTRAELEELVRLRDRVEAIPTDETTAEELAERKAELRAIKGRAAVLADRVGYSG